MMNETGEAIPWFEPVFDESDIEAVRNTVASGFVNEGPAVRAFEQELRTFFGVDYAIMTPSGTMALALSLMALGVKHGDSVLIPDITFIGTAGAVRLAGAEPILVDVDPTTFLMDPEDAARRLQPGSKAILPVHLNGRGADLQALRRLAEEKGLCLLEDAAEAIGSRTEQGYLGALSDAGCFSLAPTKIITSGQGGFVLTHRQDVRDQLIRLKDHGRLSRSGDEHPVTGYNFKVTDLQGTLALSQWKKLPQRIEQVRRVDQLYRDALEGVKNLSFPARPPTPGYLMWPDFVSSRRDKLVMELGRQGIALRPFWPPLHMQPAYATDGSYPGAVEASRTACWLPCSPSLSDENTRRVSTAIRTFLGAGSP